jgi:hypothetical protein
MRRGQAYERWVSKILEASYGPQYIPGLWFSYWDNGHIGAVQLDGLLIELSKGRITLIEIKHQHTAKAWQQLNNFYRPVVEEALLSPRVRDSLWEVCLVEIANWIDFSAAPGVQIWELSQARPGAFNVMQMRKN